MFSEGAEIARVGFRLAEFSAAFENTSNY